MFKQSPSRNSRTKGVRVRYVLQICLLVGVCFWLIYQVKHSRDKKKEFDENGAKISANEGSENMILKHGRKELRPLDEEVTEKRDEEEEEEGEEELPHEKLGSVENERNDAKEVIEEDVEENNHDEEEEQEEEEKENKPDGKEMEEEGSKIEETESADDEENEGKKDHDEEKMGNESEHKEDQMETDHEAREEQYNADDASSAVAHDTKITTAETENLSSGQENKSTNATETDGEQNSSVAENDAVNVTTSWDKSKEKEESFNLNSTTATTEENEQLHTVTELAPQENVKLQNATDDVNNGGSNTLQITEPENVDNNATTSVSNQSDSNSTLPYHNVEFSASENITQSNMTVEEKVDSNEDSGEANEGSGSSSDENTDATQHNSLDSSMAQDVENRIDLDVLPEFKTEGDSNDDAAAE